MISHIQFLGLWMVLFILQSCAQPEGFLRMRGASVGTAVVPTVTLDESGYAQFTWTGPKDKSYDLVLIDKTETDDTFNLTDGVTDDILTSRRITTDRSKTKTLTQQAIAKAQKDSFTYSEPLIAGRNYLVQFTPSDEDAAKDESAEKKTTYLLFKAEMPQLSGASARTIGTETKISWNAVPGATSYEIFADEEMAEKLGDTTGTRFTVSDGNADGYWIRARRGSLVSPELIYVPYQKSEVVIERISSTNANGYYRTGDELTFQVDFTKPVITWGEPTLPLAIAAKSRSAKYVSGSGTKTLLFSYKVQADDDSAGIDTETVMNGQIADMRGVTVPTVLPEAGHGNRLIENKTIGIDNISPTAPQSIGFTSNFSSTGDVSVSWLSSVDTQLKGHEVQLCSDGLCSAGCTTAKATTSDHNILLESIPAGRYFACVKGVDKAGNTSALTAGLTEVLVDLTSPTAPSAVAFAGPSSNVLTVPVTWTESTDSNLVGHELKLCSMSNCSTSCGASSSSLHSPANISGDDGHTYYACVRGVDLVGRSSAWVSSSSPILLQTSSVYVDLVSAIEADGTYKEGQSLTITLHFTETVHVTNGADIRLLLETGTTDRSLSLSGGDGTDTLSFLYTIQSGDVNADLNLHGTNALSLGATGAIKNDDGLNVSLVLPSGAGSLSQQKALVIDTEAPTAPSSITFAQARVSSLTFPMSWTLSSDPHFSTHNVKLCTDSACSAGCISADTSASSPKTMTGVDLGVYYGCVQGEDSFGHMTSWLASAATVTVDRVAPTVTSVTTTKADGTYKVGATVPLEVTFSENVTVSATSSISLLMETGSTDRSASYLSGNGTNKITFVYTVQSGDASANLDYAGTSALTLSGGATLRDAAGNNAVLTLPTVPGAQSVSSGKSIVIDTDVPAVPTITSPTATSTSNVTTVSGSAETGSTVTIKNGSTVLGTAIAAAGAYSLTLATPLSDGTYSLTAQATDVALNDSAASAALALTVDTISPTNPSAVGFASTASATLSFDMSFALSTDTNFATHNTKICENSDCATDCRSVSTSTTSPKSVSGLNSATYYGCVQGVDSFGHTSAWVASLATVSIDTDVPSVVSLSSNKADGTYKAGEAITITVLFSEDIFLTNPSDITLQLETGTTDRILPYAATNGARGIDFLYTVQAGDTATRLNYKATNSLSRGATGLIKDNVGNNGSLTLPALNDANALGVLKNIVIDTTAPATPVITAPATTSTTAVTVISGTAEADSIVTLFDGSTNLGTATATGGNFSLTLGSPLSDGDYSLTAYATDGAGNQSATSAARALKVDTIDPSAPAAVAFAGAYSTSLSFPMSWTNSADTNFSTHNTKICTDTACSVGCLSADTSLSTPKTVTGVNTGIYYGCVQGQDSLGRVSAWIASAATITVDTSAPAAPMITSPALTSTSDVSVISGTAEAGSTVTIKNGSTVLGTAVATGGNFSLTLGTPLSNGDYSLTAQAADAAGNSGTASGARALKVDTIAPIAPSSVGFSSAVSPTLSFSMSWANSTDTNFQTHNTKICTDTGCSVGCISSGTSLSTPKTMTGVNTGVYYGCVQGQDTLGLTSAWIASATTVTVDASAPTVVSVTSAKSNGSYKTGESIVIDVTFSENVYLTNSNDITLQLETGTTDHLATYSGGDTTSVLSFTYVVQAGDSSTDLDYKAITSLALGAGGLIKDNAGNDADRDLPAVGSGSSLGGQKAIVIDTAAPSAPTITAPGTTSNSNVTIVSGAAETGSTVTIKDGSTTLGTAVASAGAYSLTLATPLSDGTYSLTAFATDVALNQSATSSAVALTVDTINPAAPSTVAFAGAYSTSLTFPMTWTNSTDTNFSTHNTKICTDTGCSVGCISAGTSISTPKTMTGVNAGVYYGCVQGQDSLSRVSAWIASAATITVDTSAPAAPVITAPALTSTSNVTTVSGTAEAGSTVTIKNGSTVLGTAVATGGNFSLTLGTPLSDGDYSLTAQAADTAGNVGTASAARALKVDTINPAAPASVGFSSATTSSLTFPMSWTNSTDTNFATHNTKICTDTGCSAGCISSSTSLSTPKTMTGVNAGVYYGCVQGEDSLGRTSAWIASATTMTVDTSGPTVVSVSSAKANGSYKAGESIVIDVTFSENVYLTNSSNITLQLETGTTDHLASYSGGDTTNVLSFTYVVQAGDSTTDLDYKATTSLALGAGGLIKDNSGNNADRDLPAVGSGSSLGDQKAIVIDTAVPSAPTITAPGTTSTSNVTIVSGAAETGSTVTIKDGSITLGTAVASAGTYSLTLATPLSDGTYSLTAFATDVALNQSATSSAVALIVDTINPAAPSTVAFAGAFSTSLTFPMTWTNSTDTNFSTHNTKICTDTGCSAGCISTGTSTSTPKSMTGVNAGVYYGCVQGQDSLSRVSAWIASSATITVDTSAPAAPVITAPALTSTSNVTTVSGTAEAGSTVTIKNGSTVLGTAVATGGNFSLTLGTPLGDGDYSLTAQAADTAGNVGTASAARALKVDTINPAAPASVGFASATSTTPTFSMSWTNSTDTNFSTHNTKICSDTGCSVDCISAGTSLSTPKTMTGVNTGIYYGCVQGEDTLGRTSAWIASSTTVTVDTSVPTVVSVSSAKANGSYKAGESIVIDVTFSENVYLTNSNNITLQLETGTTDQLATYSGGDTSSVLSFTYVVQAGDTTTDLDYKATTSLSLGAGGLIKDVASNNADLALPTAGSGSSLGGQKAIVIDTAAPSAPTITAPGTTSTSNVTIVSGAAETGSTVTVKDGSTTIGTVVASAGAYSLTLATPLSDGTYSLTAFATDVALNQSASSAAVALKVDTINPTAPSTVAFAGAYSTSLTFPMTWTNSTDTNFSTHNTKLCTDTGCSAGCISAGTSASTPRTMTGVNAGVYYGCVQGQDSLSRISAWIASSATITVDTSAPAAPVITAPALTTTANVTTISGTAEAGSTVTIKDGSTVLGTAVATGGNFSLTLSTPLSDGNYSLTAQAADLAGNVGTASAARALKVDTINPTAPASVAFAGAYSTSLTFPMTWTNSTDTNFSTHNTKICTDTGCSAGCISVDTSTSTPKTMTGVNAGVYYGCVQGLDTLGRTSAFIASSATITVDTSAPAAPVITAPALTTQSAVSVISGTAEAGSTVTIKDGSTVLGTAVATGGNFSLTLGTPLSDGDYALTAQAADPAGNVGTASSARSLKVDTINPSAPASVAFSGAYSTSLTFPMTWTNSTDTNFSTHNTKICTDAGCSAGCISIDTSASTPKTMTGVNAGIYRGCVQGLDSVGRTSAWIASAASITVDNAAPTVTSVSSAKADGRYKANETIVINVTFSENVYLTNPSNLSLQLETGTVDQLAVYSGGDTTNILSFTYTVQAGDDTSDLEYLATSSLSLGAGGLIKDVAGNTAVRTLPNLGSGTSLGGQKAIVIDTSAPSAPTITAPGTTSTSNVSVVSGAAETGSTVTIKNGATVIGTAVASAGAYSVTLAAPLSDGTYSLTALATDVAGNISASSSVVALKVDTINPSAPASVGFSAAYSTTPTFSMAWTNSTDTNFSTHNVKLCTDNLCTTSCVSADTSLSTPKTMTGANGGSYYGCVQGVDTLGRTSAWIASVSKIDVDTSAPTVTSVSASTADGSYKAGTNIYVTVTFSEAVWMTNSTAISIQLSTGSTNRLAANPTGDGTATLTFTYQVQAGDVSSDLDYLGTNSLSLGANGLIKDLVGNNAVLTLQTPGAANSIAYQKAIIIDTSAPIAPTITAPGAYSTSNVSIVSGAAETGSTVTIKSGSTVIGTAVASAGAYSATLGSPLGNGDYVITAIATDVAGNVSAVSTTLNLRVHPAAPAVPTITAFTTPTKITTPVFSGTADANVTVKVYAGATLIITTTSDNSGAWSATSSALTHGTYSITATATDPAARVSAASAGASLNIDTVAPTVTSVTSSTADATYGYNQAINARVNFSEVVTVTGTPTLTLELGASDPAAAYTTGSTTNQLNFSFTTAYGQASSDLDYVSTTSLALAGGTITDAAGNSAVLTLPSPGAANSIGANKAIVIDAVKPVITNVTSTTADGNYAATNVIDVTVTFNKVVTVAGGTPTLTLALSPSNRTVNLSSGSGSTDLHFSYTVTNPDVSTDLNYSSTTALALAGATIKDARSNDADLTLPVTGAGNSLAGNKAIVIKGTNVSPSISTATTTQNAYSNSPITPINFNQTSSGTDFDVDNDAITYSCLYDTTINSTLDGGGTACTSLPNVSVSFNTATGTLSWTPSDAATNNVTSIKDYEIIVTGSDNNNTTPSRAYAGVKVIRPFTSTIGYDAGASANYTFDSTKIDFSGGYARLGEIDQKDDDNTSTGFSAAAQVGTVWDSSYIRLGSSGGCDASLYNCATLDATWVPSYTSLINYYTMEGNRNDVKGSNNMTAGSGGAPTVAATGKINGGSLTFDGVAQSALTTRTIQDDFTISLWMKTNMTEGSNCWEFYSGYGVVNMELSGFQNDFGMSICGGKIIVGTNKDASNDLSRSSSFVADDTWHFVVFTREKATGTIKIYVDGRLDGTGTGASAASLTGSATITVGNMNVGSAYYRGSIDELAYWSTVLDANEIQTIYDRQSARFAGSFTSRIVDTGVTGNPWSTLGWTTTQPFFKELTDYASGALQNETTSEYSGLPTNSLMTGLLGLWHLNESSAGTVTGPKDFKDDSGANNHGVYVTQGTFGSPGRFGNSANVSGSNGYVKVNADLLNRIPLTISAWFRPEDLRYAPSVVSNDSDGAFGAGFGIRANGTLIIDQHNSFSGDVGTAIKPNEWHHVVVVYESATKIRAYQNGKEVYNATIADYSGSLNGSAHVLFGAHNTTSLYPFKGSIDEVGIWGRSMTAAEALSLYRRSANRIRYQIRSCSVADCSDAVFKGPTNNLKSTFSELFNNTTPIGMAGDVQKGAASLAFSAFSGSGLSVSSNRYFQYRAFLESDDTQNLCTYGTAKPCSPELKDVLIGPAHYNTTVPTIASTSAVSFYNINTFTESLGSGGCGGTAKYNLSVNGTNWFYWTGTAWGAANGTYAQANTAAQINSNAAAFGAAVGRTNLYVKAFLNSNGQQACELDALSIGGNATH